MTQHSQICTYLDWDTEFFGYRIGRVNSHQISHETAREIDEWASDQAIDCLYFLCASDDPLSTQIAEDNNYHLMDVRITFQQKLSSDNQETKIAPTMRHYQQGDLEYLQETSRTAYTQTRFYYDPNFTDEQCAKLYELWLYKSCETDYADAVVVAEHENKAAGYVTCHLNQISKTGSVGLVGVVEAARGQRLGKHLVDYALTWFSQQGMEQIEVVTQGRNIAAQRLYQRCDFVTKSVQFWYHKWFNK